LKAALKANYIDVSIALLPILYEFNKKILVSMPLENAQLHLQSIILTANTPVATILHLEQKDKTLDRPSKVKNRIRSIFCSHKVGSMMSKQYFSINAVSV
jgi:hypothetical protein